MREHLDGGMSIHSGDGFGIGDHDRLDPFHRLQRSLDGRSTRVEAARVQHAQVSEDKWIGESKCNPSTGLRAAYHIMPSMRSTVEGRAPVMALVIGFRALDPGSSSAGRGSKAMKMGSAEAQIRSTYLA